MVALLLKCKCETRANIFIFKCGSPTNQKHGHVVSGWLQQTAAAQNSWKLRDSCRLHKQTKGGLVFGIQEATSSANNKHPSAERWVSNLAAPCEISISLFCPNFRCASISSTYPGLSVSLSQGCTPEVPTAADYLHLCRYLHFSKFTLQTWADICTIWQIAHLK